MKRIVFLLALALVWGCQDRPFGPVEQVPDDGASYGSSAVTIPGMGGLAKAARGAVYKFVLTITGRDMDPMTFAFPLGERDTMVMIETIPAGPSRLFTGVLHAPEGPTHEGSAVAEILPGKVAYVKLFLRKAGSARVDVIIEGINDEQPDTGGCFEISGEIENLSLDGFMMKVLEKNDSQLWAYVFRGTELAGKFWGTFSEGMMFSGTIAMPVINMDAAMFKGGFVNDFTAFKGEVYSMVDTTKRIGIMYGNRTSCDPVEPPPHECIVDTMGSPSSCKDAVTWVKYATEECQQNGLSLGNYSFLEPCDTKDEKTFSYICYECCR
ncbi:MAG: hypothetical protein JXA18_11040 [Chitinispirillaceae bacterium]|nr:hypothetical protein [Chitinispirillaceae bacterium]